MEISTLTILAAAPVPRITLSVSTLKEANEPETVITSGTIRYSVSNHHSIFQFTSITHNSSQKEVITQFYDFCNSNIDIFVEQLQTALAEEHNDTSSFSDFLEIYSRKIEEIFKLEKPKMSKRNAKNNPWFIDSLNVSINRKWELYNDWHKTKSKKKSRWRLTVTC